MRLIPLVFLFLMLVYNLVAQDVTGDWQGIVWQTNSTDTFQYELHLEQDGNAVFGQATSGNGDIQAMFQVTGQIKNGALTFQEIKQISPSSPQWCLKFAKTNLLSNGTIKGQWSATACTDGQILLYRKGVTIQEQPLSYVGRWTGHLSQSDRPYGFYFELELREDGTGTSHIVSEGAGGEAVHSLNWEEEGKGIRFYEPSVNTRTQADWKWCLKSAVLTISKHHKNYELQGDWTGYIEGTSPENGTCAPGSVFLTKAIVTKVITEKTATEEENYTKETGRSVRVDRVIQIQNKNIHIRVWDNGIVDGDVLTLFLNGRRIIKEYRVNKRKWSIPVEVLDGENLLILHAEDLGDIPPNTIAVSIDDGVEEQIIVVSSNLEESGAILVQPFKL